MSTWLTECSARGVFVCEDGVARYGPIALKNTWFTCITLFVWNLCVDMEIGLQGSG